MLIKRTERQARRGALAAALASQASSGLDRRTFLRRSGLAAGGLAALGALPLASVRKAQGRPAARHGRRGHHPQEHLHALLGRLHRHRRSRQRRLDRPGAELGQSPINRGSHCAKGASVRELVHGDRRLKYPMKLVERPVDPHLLGPGDQRDRRQADRHPRQVRARIRSTGSAPPSSPTKAPICSASSARSGAPTTPTTRRASAIRPPSPASPIPGATAR